MFPYDFSKQKSVCLLVNILTWTSTGNHVRSYQTFVPIYYNVNLMERTNKMQPCSRIYYSNIS